MRVIGVPVSLSIPILSNDKRFFRQTLDGISGSIKTLQEGSHGILAVFCAGRMQQAGLFDESVLLKEKAAHPICHGSVFGRKGYLPRNERAYFPKRNEFQGSLT